MGIYDYENARVSGEPPITPFSPDVVIHNDVCYRIAYILSCAYDDEAIVTNNYGVVVRKRTIEDLGDVVLKITVEIDPESETEDPNKFRIEGRQVINSNDGMITDTEIISGDIMEVGPVVECHIRKIEGGPNSGHWVYPVAYITSSQNVQFIEEVGEQTIAFVDDVYENLLEFRY